MSANGSGLQFHGCLIRVPDLRLAESFYCGELRFTVIERRSGWLRLEGIPGLFLEEVPQGPNPAFGQARVSLALKVADLAGVSRRLASRKIPLITGDSNPLSIGVADCFCDPFGNVHTLLQPNAPLCPGEKDFQIHSVGVKTPIGLIPAARHVYEVLLGFKAQTERLYPPTLPLGNPDGSLAFVIHDKHPWEPDLRPRAPLYPDDMGAVLVFLASDAAAVHETLAASGRVRLTARQPFQLGRRFGIVDNAGIPSEMWEYN
jgi:hypothetical protein